MMRLLIVTLCVAGFAAAGCNMEQRPTEGEVPPPEARDAEVPAVGDEENPDPEDIVDAVGTVRYVDLEGGFYGIVVSDTARYNPMNLGEAYREDGLAVRFRGVLRRDVMTTQQWGRPLEILDITSVEEFIDE